MTHEDFRKLFNPRNYQYTLTSDYKWGMLISLYTGFRMNEIISFTIRDLHIVCGIEYFQVKEMVIDKGKGRKKTVGRKTTSTLRNIPIAKKLYDYGFSRWWERGIKVEGGYLFHDRDPAHYSKEIIRWMRNRDVQKPEGGLKDFTSLRHMFATKLDPLSASKGLKDAISGHSSRERSVREQTYTDYTDAEIVVKDLKEKKAVLDMLDFGIDDLVVQE